MYNRQSALFLPNTLYQARTLLGERLNGEARGSMGENQPCLKHFSTVWAVAVAYELQVSRAIPEPAGARLRGGHGLSIHDHQGEVEFRRRQNGNERDKVELFGCGYAVPPGVTYTS